MISVLFLGLNRKGEQVYQYLTECTDTDVLALVTEREQLSLVHELEPDILISAGFEHMVPEEILSVPDRGAINLHGSYLPYNRGTNANVWSILDEHPAGVTIHFMTPEIDAGPIIDRRKVPVHPDDTAGDLYERIEQAQVEQFKDVWPSIRDGTVSVMEQDPCAGTYHDEQDFVERWELDLEESRPVGEVIDLLRGLTLPPYKAAYFERDGDRYYVNIDIVHEDERETPPNE